MNQNTDKPAWYDEAKLVRARYARAYTGWVINLGDGTCRLANDAMLGENGPQWGDRVDLFFDPCDEDELPFIGYRIYDPTTIVPGRHFGVSPERGPEGSEQDEEHDSH